MSALLQGFQRACVRSTREDALTLLQIIDIYKLMIIGCSRVGVHKSYLVVAIGLTRIGVVPRLRDSRGRWIAAHAIIESIRRTDDEIESAGAPPRAVTAHLARVIVGVAVAIIATFRVRRNLLADALKAVDYLLAYLTTPRKAWAVYGYRGTGA